MKEIYYYGNLNEDIEKTRKNNKISNIFLFALALVGSALVIDILAIFTYFFLGMNMKIIKNCFLFLTIPVEIISMYSAITKEVKKYKKEKIEKEEANKKIYVLSKCLNKEHKVNLSKKNILSSERIIKIETKKTYYANENAEETSLSSAYKNAVTYFYMLDRNEQIQILKQYKEGLFLLEEHEIAEPIQELEKIKSKTKK